MVTWSISMLRAWLRGLLVDYYIRRLVGITDGRAVRIFVSSSSRGSPRKTNSPSPSRTMDPKKGIVFEDAKAQRDEHKISRKGVMVETAFYLSLREAYDFWW